METAGTHVSSPKPTIDRRIPLPYSALSSLFMRAPAFISVVRGSEHVFDLVNPHYQHLFPNRDLLGRPIREALPELEGQGFYERLDQVLATGEAFVGKEM